MTILVNENGNEVNNAIVSTAAKEAVEALYPQVREELEQLIGEQQEISNLTIKKLCKQIKELHEAEAELRAQLISAQAETEIAKHMLEAYKNGDS